MRIPAALGSLCALALCTSGCAATADSSQTGFRVVVTTPILADIASEIGGEDAVVTGLIPPGKDPHTFEPSLRTIREVANADLNLSNGYLLEPQALVDTLHESSSAPVVEVADHAATRGAVLVPLVENVALDAVWLGLRVTGAPQDMHSVDFHLESAEGPGDVAAYVVSTFGTPEVLFNTRDGLKAPETADGNAQPGEDTASLPANAHTHVSWAFSQPGVYRLRFGATGTEGREITVAVGVEPPKGMRSIDSGHVDITADLEAGIIELQDQGEHFNPDTTALTVPSSVLQEIPAQPAYRFLGTPGSETYLLPQAVLGKHVHGEVDPHLWHNARNGIAYAEVIAEQMAQADPSHGEAYRRRAQHYIGKLRATDAHVHRLIDAIPPARRHLVTTHHGYAYLEQGYGMDVAGFVTPNPGVEPSPRDVIALRRTLENLAVPAVFVEPMEQPSTATLRNTAQDLGVRVCSLYGDSLDDSVPSYLDLLNFNARSLNDCLAAPNQEATNNKGNPT